MQQAQLASASIAYLPPLVAKQSRSVVTCHQKLRRAGLPRTSPLPKHSRAGWAQKMSSLRPLRQQFDPVELLVPDGHQLSTSSNLLWGLHNEQRQALLFLAMSSGLLATTDVTQAADLQFLADLSIDKGQAITFLVNNPFVTLGVAIALYLIVPRVLRLATRYILLPAAVAGGVYLVITNPSTSWRVVSSAFGYITANPAVTSIAILGALALALSPYVLIIGGIVLVFSATSLPGPLKRLLPAPVVEADRQLDFVREQVKGPTSQAAEKLRSIFAGNTKALSPAHLDSSRLVSAPRLTESIIDDEQ
ncbi:TPA: hypothetical protein ACH3X1_009520 [Trebouxia sp. C0004]